MCPLIRKTLIPVTKEYVVQRLVDICASVLEKRLFNAGNLFLLFTAYMYTSPLEKEFGLSFKQTT